MNLLAGLKTKGVQGKIEINGSARQMRTFRTMSAYITQKDHLLPHLSVEEYMTVAAHLKLGNRVPDAVKLATIGTVMKTLGLEDSRRTHVANLSGGECKRLAIGLELVHNPYILFLDEPTSGLDSSSSMQCISLLKEIAASGRMVVATIHQPNSRLLEQFDHLYIVANGQCMYQGAVNDLVPFLQSGTLSCPSYHNPADFVIDVASGEYGDIMSDFVKKIANGRLLYQEERLAITDEVDGDRSSNGNLSDESASFLDNRADHQDEMTYPSSFMTQVGLLFKRTMQSVWREKMLTLLRLVAHIIVALMMGLLYWKIGDDAAMMFNNAGLLFFTQLFLLFTAMMPTVLTFPLERQVLLREHANHWYSLKAYYLAKTSADIPFQILFPTFYVAIVYLMTGQPMEVTRFLMFTSICIANSLVAQGIGLLVGAAADVQIAVFVAPAVTIPFLLFSGFFVNLDAIPSYMGWISYVSFMRYSFEGSMLAIYAFERDNLACSQPYCHYKFASKILEQFNMQDSLFMCSILSLLVCFFVIRLAAYFVLRWKIRTSC